MSKIYYPQCRAILSVVFDNFTVGEGTGPALSPTVVQVIPTQASVTLNGYKEADVWSMSFDAKALPFNPDLISSIAVQIYAFDALGTAPAIETYATDENMLVAGLADNADITLDGSGRVFTCDGRDYTCLMLDKQWDPKLRVPTGEKISKVIQTLVDNATGAKAHGGATLVVEYLSNKPEPNVGKASSKSKKKGIAGKDGDNVWDVIYRTCLRESLICFVRGASVIITDPQTMTLQNASKAAKVAYGRNLESLRVERKLGKEKTPQVIATSYSAKRKASISAAYPEKKDPITTGIGTEKDEKLRIAIDNIDSVDALKEIAQTYYNNLARGESKISFSTKDLTDMSVREPLQQLLSDGESRLTPGGAVNLLALRAGDPVYIGFDPFNAAEMPESMTPEARYEYLMAQGFSRTVASLVAREFDRIEQFQRPFYTREVTVDWAVAEGISISVEAINFVNTDRDDTTAKDNPTAASTKTHTSGRAS